MTWSEVVTLGSRFRMPRKSSLSAGASAFALEVVTSSGASAGASRGSRHFEIMLPQLQRKSSLSEGASAWTSRERRLPQNMLTHCGGSCHSLFALPHCPGSRRFRALPHGRVAEVVTLRSCFRNAVVFRRAFTPRPGRRGLRGLLLLCEWGKRSGRLWPCRAWGGGFGSIPIHDFIFYEPVHRNDLCAGGRRHVAHRRVWFLSLL